MEKQVTFLTVLKSRKIEDDYGMSVGYSIYEPEHVYALQKQIEQCYKKPHRFICLTDFDNLKCDSIKLKYNLPGWWSKMELFQPDLVSKNPEDVFIYFDLDTCLVSDITELIDYPHTMSALAEVSASGLVPGRFGSGVMAWRGDWSHVYHEFMKDTFGNIQKYKVGGDQHVLHEACPDFKPIQHIIDGCINYKYQLRDKENLPSESKIIYFHGLPKPWKVRHRWLDHRLYRPE